MATNNFRRITGAADLPVKITNKKITPKRQTEAQAKEAFEFDENRIKAQSEAQLEVLSKKPKKIVEEEWFHETDMNAYGSTGAQYKNVSNETVPIADKFEAKEAEAAANTEDRVYPQYNLKYDKAGEKTYRPNNPDCELNFEIRSNTLYIKDITCEKKEGKEGGQGKILVRDTIKMLDDIYNLKFILIQLLPVAGRGSDKGLRTEAEAEAELNKLRMNYIDSWRLEPVGDGTLTGSVEAFMNSDFKEDNMKGGSRRSKKTKRRRYKKTAKKRKTKRRRQTKKRGKR